MLSPQTIKHVQAPSGYILKTLFPKKKTYFTATEAADVLGISKQTLLRYEARGVFPKAQRNRVNRWREYTETDIQTLRNLMGR